MSLTRFSKITIVFIALFFVHVSQINELHAGSKNQKIISKNKYRLANECLKNYNFYKALELYKDLLKESPRNFDVNYKIGLCFLNMATEKEKALAYIQRAIKYTNNQNKLTLSVYFNLAKAHHINYQFEEAIVIYRKLMKALPDHNNKFYKKIKKNVNFAINGKNLMRTPINFSIINLGSVINSSYDEHSPCISADESTIVFTSRRKGTGESLDYDGQYFEDIYISTKTNGIWSPPKGIATLNTINHDASISISADGQKLYIYKADYDPEKQKVDGNIYVSELVGNEWTSPKKLGPNINSKYKESHASISADGRAIYFSSNRPGGYGSMDIYRSYKLPNGKWSKAENLGPEINTENREDSPFIHPDGITLYYSSSGHNSMGGLDVFRSRFINGKWTKARNIGYPINSTETDVCFTPSADGKRAYFASHRKGTLGRQDIFMIQTPDEKGSDLFVLKGKIVSTDGKVVSKSKITIREKGKVIGIYKPNTATGKFLFIIDAGKTYDLEIIAEGYRTLRTQLNIPANYANKENQSIITLLPVQLRTKKENVYPSNVELVDKVASKLVNVPTTKSKVDNSPKKETPKKEITPKKEPKKIPIKKKEPVKTITNSKPKISTPKKQKKLVMTSEDLSKIKKKTPKKETDTGLAFTILLGSFDVSQPEILNKFPGAKETLDSNNKYQYTYKKFRKHKSAVRELEQVRKVKGFKNSTIKMLAKNAFVHEKKGGEIYYTIQLMALKVPIGTEFFDNIDNVKVHKGNDGLTRYTYRKFKSFAEAKKVLKKMIRIGYWDSFIRTVINDQVIYQDAEYNMKQPYTIQVMALRSPQLESYFKKLGKVDTHIDKDGIYRYTYGTYYSKREAQQNLSFVLGKGYSDAFVRPSLPGEKSNPETKKNFENYYTVQVMALKTPISINYFKNLGKGNIIVRKGKDGLTRYTYLYYKKQINAEEQIPNMKKKGYFDAFSRKIKWYKSN